jgi:IS30 family transposase
MAPNQYLPKGSDLSRHYADDLRAIEDRLNNRPPKALGWRIPQRSSLCHHERVNVARTARIRAAAPAEPA